MAEEEKYYEVVVFHKMGDFFEMHVDTEPNFTCIRLQSDCVCESANEHDHFLIGENEDRDDPPPSSHKYLHNLLVVKYYIDHKRPKWLGAITYPLFYRYFLEVTYGCPNNILPLMHEAELQDVRKFVADNQFKRGEITCFLIIPVETVGQLYKTIRECHAVKINR